MNVPRDLVPKVRELIAKHRSRRAAARRDNRMSMDNYRIAYWGPPLTPIPESTEIWRYMDLA